MKDIKMTIASRTDGFQQTPPTEAGAKPGKVAVTRVQAQGEGSAITFTLPHGEAAALQLDTEITVTITV